MERILSAEEAYLFNEGKLVHSYLKFGAHQGKVGNRKGIHFTLWAPAALRVGVAGPFNQWDGSTHLLTPLGTTGIWTGFMEGLPLGTLYKYDIHTLEGERLLKADPFAFQAEVRPATASVVANPFTYRFKDAKWMKNRKTGGLQDQPLHIYEVHLGSWKRHSEDTLYTYRELADELIPYVRSMGYTHLELLPIMEHPFDGSWGYQITGYFAATSRFGPPEDLMHLIDRAHQEGIGVLLDWVPGHFCKDAHGLARFDGTSLYEGEEHQQWGTLKFDFRRKEVWSFLLSNAMFWFEVYHVDGLRVDGVTSMIRLDYGKEGGLWQPNPQGGVEDLEAVAFLQELNRRIFESHPEALMIAEESSDWPLVTRPWYDGGLSFNYKWNMGWMNDTLRYMETDFKERRDQHHLLTFSAHYAFSENFILPLSHDEVVHGKKSLIGRMPGDYWQGFAGLRLLHLYQLTHPGKKLTFMGSEFGQFIEWRYHAQLDWLLLSYESHRKHQAFVAAANKRYLAEPSLWEIDGDWAGFRWIDPDNREQGILSFVRFGKKERDYTLVIANFHPMAYENFRIGIPRAEVLVEAFNTDRLEYGGSGVINQGPLVPETIPSHGQGNSIRLWVPPLGLLILKPQATKGRS